MSDPTPPPYQRAPRALPPAAYVSANETSIDMEPPTLRGYLAALRRYAWLVLLVGGIGIGLSGIALAWRETVYGSSVVIQIPEEGGGSAGGGLAGLAATITGGSGSLRSQAQVITSRLLLGQVVDSLNLRLLREVPGFPYSQYKPVGFLSDVIIAPTLTQGTLDLVFGPHGLTARHDGTEVTAAYGEPVRFSGLEFVVRSAPALDEIRLHIVNRDAAIDALRPDVRASVREGTNLLDIVAYGYDPTISQMIGSATARNYQEFRLSRAREQAERRRRYVFQQLQTTEELLQDTQDELTRFRQNEGLYSARAQAEMDQAGRGDLEIRRAELIANRQVFASMLQRLEREGPGSTEEVLRAIVAMQGSAGNPAVEAAYETLIAYEAQRDRMLLGAQVVSRSNPDFQATENLIASSRRNLLGLVQGQLESLDARISALEMVRGRIDEAFQHLAQSEPEEMRLMLRLEAIAEAAQDLRERYYTAGMVEAGTVDEVAVLDAALPGQPSGTGPLRTLLLGLVFGLLVGGAGAILLDGANRSIRKRDDLERLLRVPGLGVIPRIRMGSSAADRLRSPIRMLGLNGNGSGRRPRDFVAATQVHSLPAEAYRTVRTNLVFSHSIETPRHIMVTSPSSDEGKTTTAANLAVSFAHQGRRVLLIDCDLRRARIHELFSVQKEPGISELLSGEVGLEMAVRSTGVEGLSVITAGGAPSVSAADLLGGDRMRATLESLSPDFDIMIVDAPPVLVTADAPVLATQVDGVLLVIRAGQTERDTAQAAVRQLVAVGANVLGAVLNDPDSRLEERPTAYGERYAGK